MNDDLLVAMCTTIRSCIAGRTHAVRFFEFRHRRRIERSFPLPCAIGRALRHWGVWHDTIQPVLNK